MAAMAKTATTKKPAKHPDLFDRMEQQAILASIAGSYFSGVFLN